MKLIFSILLFITTMTIDLNENLMIVGVNFLPKKPNMKFADK